MANKAKPVPEGYHHVTPYLVIKGAAAAIDFYKQVFGAVEIMRMPQPDGRVGHAELKFGDSVVMMADEFPEMEIVGPKTLGNSPVGLLLYVDDVDKTVERATGRVVEGADTPQEVIEVWTFVRTRGGAWMLSAIQQAN